VVEVVGVVHSSKVGCPQQPAVLAASFDTTIVVVIEEDDG